MAGVLDPFRPSAGEPWNRLRASHLLRRAGFAAGEEDVEQALSEGLEATLECLLDDGADSAPHDELDVMGERIAARNDIALLRAWWVRRMCLTARPLRARMAVFWHDHFATSNVKVQSAPLMLRQLRTFEHDGLDGFETLLLGMSRDPAMIIWLDGNDNSKGRPNENYARELFELFSLGVGNYTERDIKEAARAFTGWHEQHGRFRFVPRAHDDGEKRVFDTTGPLDGDDVVQAAVSHPACASFIAGKLLREFLCPDPPAELVAETANRLRETKFDIRTTLRTLLVSRAMFDPRWYRARIKSPVEFAVGMVRSLNIDVPGRDLADTIVQMGQRLFEPPSVKGWNGHRAWLNSTTMLVRLNAAIAASREAAAAIAGGSGDNVVNACAELTLDGEIPDPLKDRLDCISGDKKHRANLALEMLLTAPEYQLA